jgi:hypothetical protein
MPIRIWKKTHPHYYWFKYNFYKPIRNWLCHYGYGYHLCDDHLIKRRKQFIDEVKENAKRMDN